MSISDELQKLDELRRSGALSHEEFELAKRRILEEPESADRDALEQIRIQNEIAQLDRAWELERENYMMTGRYGHRSIPGRTSSVLGGIFIVGFGIFWTVMASSILRFDGPGMFSFFPLFGVLFVLFGAGISIRAFVKAGQYKEAEGRYRQRRGELQERNRRT